MYGLYKDSNGEEAEYPRYYGKAEGRLKREQRKLSLMEKGSKIGISKEENWLEYMRKWQIIEKIFCTNYQGS